MSQFIEMFTDKGNPLTMIKSFADVSTGGTPSKAHPEYWNGDKPWVSAEDMKSKYVYDTCEKVTEEGYATCKIIPVDTLMYVCRGSIGVMAINKIECATNQSICRATCHNNVCNVEFLYHALMYQRDNIKKKGTGTSFKSLNQTTFSELEIELPPYDEQMKFVTIAEQADKSEFDGIKSQFIEMFGGGNWPEKCLGEVGSFTRGGGFQKSDYVEHGIPCIHYGQIHTKFGPFISSHITEISSDLESKTKFASNGDLIIAITSEDTEGSCKSTAWLGDYSVAVGGHAAIYKHSMNPLYISFFFQSTLFNHAKMEYVHGTKVFEIRPDDIAKILVPCPPISLQEQFATIARQADKSENHSEYRMAS